MELRVTIGLPAALRYTIALERVSHYFHNGTATFGVGLWNGKTEDCLTLVVDDVPERYSKNLADAKALARDFDQDAIYVHGHGVRSVFSAYAPRTSEDMLHKTQARANRDLGGSG